MRLSRWTSASTGSFIAPPSLALPATSATAPRAHSSGRRSEPKAPQVALLNTDNPARPTLLRTIRPPFLAHDVVFDPSRDRAWITSGNDRAIAKYDTQDRRQVLRLVADAPPQHVSFNGTRAYVASVRASLTSGCQIAAYRIPPTGAVVVIVRWRTTTSGGGRPASGRSPLRTLTRLRRPSFECFSGRGAAAQLALEGHAYQVNVMVGNQATPRLVAQALEVARSFDLAP